MKPCSYVKGSCGSDFAVFFIPAGNESKECEIYEARFMPCNLYLEETDELDRRVDNVTNFYYWCATRVLTLDRKYAKEILNSMGMGQGSGRVLSFEGR